ncbi:hypothetical protein U9M48_004180, partial [Paspalum notatum var. saurae]
MPSPAADVRRPPPLYHHRSVDQPPRRSKAPLAKPYRRHLLLFNKHLPTAAPNLIECCLLLHLHEAKLDKFNTFFLKEYVICTK